MSRIDRSWQKFQNLRMNAKTGIFKGVRKAEDATVGHARRFILDRWDNVYEARRNIGIWLSGVGLLIFIMVAHFIFLRSGYTDIAPIRGGTYAEGMVGDISTLNPIYATTASEIAASRLMFSSLFKYDDTGSLSGDLATGYNVDKTGKIYTVSLHQRALWHDNTPLTVDDVIFTLNIIKRSSSGAPNSEGWRNIEFKKVDNTKIEFKLPSAYTPFPNTLTFSILPKHILERVPIHSLREDRFSNSPIGSGPFKFSLLQRTKEANKHTVLHMIRNPRYYKGASKVERFQLHTYSDNESLVAALKSQSINAAADVTSDSFGKLTHDPRFNGYTPTINAGVYAILNTDSEILKDASVRSALRYGLDIKRIKKDIGYNPLSADLPILDSQIASLKNIKISQYNQDKANDILEKAGWKRDVSGIRTKNNEKLILRIALKKDNEYEKVAKNIADQWRLLGIESQISITDTSDPTQNFASLVLQPRDYDVLIYNLSVGADPDVYAYWHSSQAVARGLNLSNYKDGISDDALSSGRSRPKDSLREAKYRNFVNRWIQQVPAIGLYRPAALYVSLKGVQAVNSDMRFILSTDRYFDVQNWTVRTNSVYKTP